MHLIDQQLNLMIRGRFEDAWKIAEQLEQNDPSNLRAKFNRGWFLINQGNLQEGYQCLEAGRTLKVYGSPKPYTSKPIWDQQDLTDKTVIINLESGYGDQIIYARFATELWRRGARAILCADASLHSILMRIQGVHSCITVDKFYATQHDYWIPGFSCSWLFGHTFDNIPNQPYLSANPLSVVLWKELLEDKKPKIGIRWSGSPLFEHQQFRIFPAEKLINLYKQFDNLNFVSLQRDSDLRELPEQVIDLQHLLISWEDTLACIENLDLVITSCWAYGDDHSPWYQKTTRIFRQKKFGVWDDTFKQISEELTKLFPKPQ